MADLKEEFEKLKIDEIKGELIGLALENHFNFILEKEGEEGVKKIEKGLEKLGYSLKYEEIKNFQWYPRIMDEAIYFVIKRVFGWDDEVFRESGEWGAKISFIARIMMKYVVSIERAFKETSNYWRKYYTVGELKPVEINKKERYLIIEVKIFPLFVLNIVVIGKAISDKYALMSCQKKIYLRLWETDCIFKNGKLHRFKAVW